MALARLPGEGSRFVRPFMRSVQIAILLSAGIQVDVLSVSAKPALLRGGALFSLVMRTMIRYKKVHPPLVRDGFATIMITFLIGKKTPVFQKASDKAVGSAQAERVSVTIENINQILDEIRTPSLFGDKKVFILSGLRDDEDEAVKSIFFEQGKSLVNAPHDVIVVLESLLAADVKKAEKFATVQKVEFKEAKAVAFNPFMLGDAFASGDKKKAWIAFSQVAEHGDEMEPTHGLVWWKLKDMMTKRSVFAPEQLKGMARELVSVYHESRLGGLGMRERLEKFFLTLPNLKK